MNIPVIINIAAAYMPVTRNMDAFINWLASRALISGFEGRERVEGCY